MRIQLIAATTACILLTIRAAPLSHGALIVGYTDWGECDQKVVKAVREGVNVVIWMATNMVASNESLPEISGHVDFDCIASIALQLEAENLTTTHLISFGGWDAPHPDTRFTAVQWWSVWKLWNSLAARDGWAGFDGIDWDIEGVDDQTSANNGFTWSLLNLMGEMSTLARADNYVVSLTPCESYLDITNAYFDLKLTSAYFEWPLFSYHGHNTYAYLLAKYADAFDIVSVQLYESWSHANYEINVLKTPASAYIELWARTITYGWFINFALYPGIDIPSQFVRVPPEKLVVGLANGWTGNATGNLYPGVTKALLIWPEDASVAYTALVNTSGLPIPGTNFSSGAPRGFMFWDIGAESAIVPDGTGRVLDMASGLNAFLHTRR